MIQESEIITLLVGIGVVIFITANFKRLIRIPSFPILYAAFLLTLSGWVLTVLEGLFLFDLFNFLEHVCYSLSSILIAIWCWSYFVRERAGP